MLASGFFLGLRGFGFQGFRVSVFFGFAHSVRDLRV